MSAWEAVVGLEIHVHLKTRTKMFCRCETGFGGRAEHAHLPGLPGAPGRAAGREPHRRRVDDQARPRARLRDRRRSAVFPRKNYFYPDNPKGYQISQYDEPLCVGGRLAVPGGRRAFEVGFVRAHLEEDAAKTVHVGGGTGRKIGARALADRLQPRRHAAGRDRHAAGHPLGRAGRALPPAAAPDDRRARHLRRANGGGDAPLRRQRLRAPGRLGRAPHPLGAEEHELVPLHRPRDRRRRPRSRSSSTSRAARSSSTPTTTSRHGHADAAPLEGGGGRLPLLPRARPRAGRARAGAGRAAARGAAGAARRRGSAHGRRRSASRTPGRSSPPTATRSTSGLVAAGVERARRRSTSR